MEIGKKKEDVLIFNYFLFKRSCTKSSTILGSASVETSPNWLLSSAAIFLKILLIILPDLVFGKFGAHWIKSGEAIGPISFLTQSINSFFKSIF